MLLPRSAKVPAGDESSAPGVAHAVNAFSGSVLLVEDDDEVATLVVEMLADMGFTVTRVASAAAALGALANGRTVDLVFSDVMMPGGMDGVDLAREIKRRRPGLPILLTSGYAEAAKEKAQAQGIRLLPKPFQVDALADAMSEFFDARAAHH